MKPIVLIGNGPSISGFDWNKLDGLDTFCVNSFYRVCLETGYFPTYYGLFRALPGLWGTEPVDFVKTHHAKFKTVFCTKTTESGSYMYTNEFDGIDNVVSIIRAPTDMGPPKKHEDEFEMTYEAAVWEATELLQENGRSVQEVLDLLNSDDQVDERLTSSGMAKWMVGRTNEITPEDIIHKPRWRPGYTYANSFDRFKVGNDDSSTVAARIAELLGYDFLILIGMDGRFNVSGDGLVDESSWGIKNVFNGKKLNLTEFVECNKCRTAEALIKMRKALWDDMLTSIYLKKKPFMVWNCTKDSAIDNLEYHDLDDALDKAKRWEKQ